MPDLTGEICALRYRMVGLALTILHDRHAAEDVVQMVMERACRKQSFIEVVDAGTVSAYVSAMTRNACRDWIRHTAAGVGAEHRVEGGRRYIPMGLFRVDDEVTGSVVLVNSEAMLGEWDLLDGLAEEQQLDWARKRAKNLPENQRNVVLALAGGESMADYSRRNGIAASTPRVLWMKARATLRSMAESEGLTDDLCA